MYSINYNTDTFLQDTKNLKYPTDINLTF